MATSRRTGLRTSTTAPGRPGRSTGPTIRSANANLWRVSADFWDRWGDLRRNFDTSLLLITHNLGIIAEACDRVAVMYAGRIVEIGDARTVFSDPQHPYTRTLMAAHESDLPPSATVAPVVEEPMEEPVAAAAAVAAGEGQGEAVAGGDGEAEVGAPQLDLEAAQRRHEDDRRSRREEQAVEQGLLIFLAEVALEEVQGGSFLAQEGVGAGDGALAGHGVGDRQVQREPAAGHAERL